MRILHESGFDSVLWLELEREECRRRALGRRVDIESENEFHIDDNPPPTHSAPLCERLLPVIEPERAEEVIPDKHLAFDKHTKQLHKWFGKFGFEKRAVEKVPEEPVKVEEPVAEEKPAEGEGAEPSEAAVNDSKVNDSKVEESKVEGEGEGDKPVEEPVVEEPKEVEYEPIAPEEEKFDLCQVIDAGANPDEVVTNAKTIIDKVLNRKIFQRNRRREEIR